MTSKNENYLSFDQISPLRNSMTLDFGTGPFVVSKVEIYLEDNRDTSRLDATYFPRGNFPLSFVISSMLLFRSILRFGSDQGLKKERRCRGVEWNSSSDPPWWNCLFPSERDEWNCARKIFLVDDLPYRVTYPHVSNKGKNISFINEKRLYSCATKNATFSIYIFVLNDRFIHCPFAIYFISYTGHFNVFHERKHLFAFQTSSSQSIKRLLPCPPSAVPRKAATSRANSI